MTLVKWNPVRDILNVEREFNKMFNSLGNRFGLLDSNKSMLEEEYENAVWTPLADVSENENSYYITLDLPGVTKDDLKLKLENGQLCISGERKQKKEEKNAQFHRVERTFGKYFRSFTLPEHIKEEEISAEFKEGQLHIDIPKSEEAKPKQLEIKIK